MGYVKKMALKAKKSLSAVFRLAMRNSAKTTKPKTIDSQIPETEIGNVSVSLISLFEPFQNWDFLIELGEY